MSNAVTITAHGDVHSHLNQIGEERSSRLVPNEENALRFLQEVVAQSTSTLGRAHLYLNLEMLRE